MTSQHTTPEAAIAAVENHEEYVVKRAQEVIARRVREATSRLYDAQSDLAFITNDDTIYEVRYSPAQMQQVVVFENQERTRFFEVPIKEFN